MFQTETELLKESSVSTIQFLSNLHKASMISMNYYFFLLFFHFSTLTYLTTTLEQHTRKYLF